MGRVFYEHLHLFHEGAIIREAILESGIKFLVFPLVSAHPVRYSFFPKDMH